MCFKTETGIYIYSANFDIYHDLRPAKQNKFSVRMHGVNQKKKGNNKRKLLDEDGKKSDALGVECVTPSDANTNMATSRIDPNDNFYTVNESNLDRYKSIMKTFYVLV